MAALLEVADLFLESNDEPRYISASAASIRYASRVGPQPALCADPPRRWSLGGNRGSVWSLTISRYSFSSRATSQSMSVQASCFLILAKSHDDRIDAPCLRRGCPSAAAERSTLGEAALKLDSFIGSTHDATATTAIDTWTERTERPGGDNSATKVSDTTAAIASQLRKPVGPYVVIRRFDAEPF